MKFSELWLREWVNPAIDSDALANQITMAGLEVDGVEPVAGSFHGEVVGEVVECAQHPNADKLRVTKVNVGGDRLLDIVCGAPNCRQGLKVAVELKVGRAQVRLVPDAGRGKPDVRVTRQQRLAALRAFARHHPGVAAFKLRQACLAQGLIAQLRADVTGEDTATVETAVRRRLSDTGIEADEVRGQQDDRLPRIAQRADSFFVIHANQP